MATPAQKTSAQMVGYLPQHPEQGTTTLQLSTAGTWLAMSFVLDTARTLNALEIRPSTVTGSVGVNDLTCDIYSDLNGIPNASLASSNTLSSGAIAVGTTAVFSGFSLSLSAGTQYWAVFKNVNATPASNNVTWRYGLNGTGAANQLTANNNALWGWNKVHTTNSGTAWATTKLCAVFGLRLDFADSTYAGEPISSANNSASGVGVFGTNELGATFVSPANTVWNVRGIAMYVGKIGSPPGNARFRLYNGTTLLATTSVIPPGNVSTNICCLGARFSADQLILPGTTLRAVIGTDGAGDTSNYFNTSENNLVNDANSKQLFPFATASNPANGIKKTFFNGASWVDTDTTLIPFALLLDSEGEFAVHRQLVHVGMDGGCRS